MIANLIQPHVAKEDAARNVQLDGLRAIAVALVLVSHYSVLRVFAQGLWGAIGVHAFFTLSGFLITGILLDAKPEDGQGGVKQALKAFYVRRSLRIFPLYYLFILFLYVMNVDGIRDGFIFHLLYASNVGMALRDTHLGHNSHLWSLAVEEQFYLIWPWVVLLLRRRHILPAILFMAALGMLYRVAGLALSFNDYALRMLTPAVLDSLAAGALLSVLRRERKFASIRLRARRWGLTIAAPLCLAMSVLAAFDLLPYWVLIGSFTAVVAWASVAIIDKATDGWPGFTGQLLRSRIFVYLGQRSYAIYLLHLCVPYFLVAFEEKLGLSFMHLPGLAVLIPTLVTLVLAELSWRFVERPFNGLKKHFDYKDAPVRAEAKEAVLAPG